MRLSRLVLPLLLSVTACQTGGVTLPDPTGPAFVVMSSATSLALVRGQPADPVSITVARNAATGVPVDLTASGAPAGVTVSFAPATLTGTQSTSTMNVRVAGTTTASEGTLVITATAGTLVATTRVTLAIRNP
jgi:hypothetical protein